jgi:uncharacterized protein (TIGR02391 family)
MLEQLSVDNQPLPTIERLREMQPDEIARLVLPHIALQLRRSPHGFVPRDMARAIANDAGVRVDGPSEYAELIVEGIGFLDRSGMLIDAPDQVMSHFYKLSRAGVRAASDPKNVGFTTVSGQEARTLLHPEIAKAALGDLERTEYDKAVYSAFRQLEIAVRIKSGVTSTAKNTFYDAFALKGEERGPLVSDEIETGEALSLREAFAGMYGSFRNPSAHRDVQSDPAQAMRLLITASALHYVLDALPTRFHAQ